MERRSAKLLGRYEIVAELGRGAMGVVYKARDPRIDRFVAIKTIFLNQANGQEQQEFRERFFIEAQAAGRLLHPGIVAVFDVGEDPKTGDPFIVMEYIKGQVLRDLVIGGSRPLPLNTGLLITQQIAEALDYAHEQGVVHRDIKPANILVAKEEQAKISDFGIAQLDVTHLTLPGRVLGTPAYMSPEQLEGDQVDGRSDLFSLGAILYTLVTGYSPFQGNSAMTICFKIANRDPLQPTALTPDLPSELDAVIARALAKDPGRRYQRGMDFAAELRELREKLERGVQPLNPSLWFSKDRRTWLDTGGWASFGTKPVAANQPLLSTRMARSAPNVPVQSATDHAKQLFLSSKLFSVPSWMGVAALVVVGAIAGSIFALHHLKGSGTAAAVVSDEANRKLGALPNTMSPGTILENTPPLEIAQALPVVPGSEQAKASQTKVGVSNFKPVKPNSVELANPSSHRPMAVAMIAPPLRPREATTQTRLEEHAIADSNVEIDIEDRFTDATLSLWVDNKLQYEHPLAARKHLSLLSKGAKEKVTIPVSAGDHELRIRVRSVADQYEESKSVSGNFLKGGEKILAVNFEKHTKEMRLTLR